MNRKTLIALTLAGMFVADFAMGAPSFDDKVPQSSLDACVAEVSNNADYDGASDVLHFVESKPRSISGFTVWIRTEVHNGEAVIREYRSKCATNRLDQIRNFRIRDKAVD